MSLEQPPLSPEKTIQEKILEFKQSFTAWSLENLDVAQSLKKELLQMAGLEENELIDPNMGFDYGFIKVPLKDLSVFSTICGTTGNKAFAPNLTAFLEAQGIDFIIALSDNTKPVITSAAMKVGNKEAKKISKLIEKNGGSLREEKSRVTDWSVFESE